VSQIMKAMGLQAIRLSSGQILRKSLTIL